MTETRSTAERLAEPFAPEMLRTFNKGGTNLTYVPAPEVTARLNLVLGPENWSYEVLDRWSAGERETKMGVFPEFVMAHVRLHTTIDSVASHKDGTGGQSVNFLKDEKGPIDFGDDWKGAVSDALKKAAQQYGVGLDIARKEDALKAEAAERQRNEYEAAAKAGGWESFVDHDARLDELRGRARALDEDAKTKLRAWWNEQQWATPLSVEQVGAYDEKITEFEDHAERPFDETSRSDAA